MQQGWRHKSGAVNFPTKSLLSERDDQAAYYDSPAIEPAN
jgi:hypothetical protein